MKGHHSKTNQIRIGLDTFQKDAGGCGFIKKHSETFTACWSLIVNFAAQRRFYCECLLGIGPVSLKRKVVEEKLCSSK